MNITKPQLKKLIKEEYKRMLKEKANPAGVDPNRFPTKLSQVKADPEDAKRDATSGTADGTQPDDVIGVTPNYTAPVAQLKPSQSSMNIAKALAQALSMLDGRMPTGGDLGAFISSDSHIMDGHHRWVATAMVDPSKEVGGYLVDFPGTQLIAILNAITVGRLGNPDGKAGKGGFEQFRPEPILRQLMEYYQDGIPGKFPWSPEEVRQTVHEHGGGEGEQAIRALAGRFAKNVTALKFEVPPGAPARPDMPVIDGKEAIKTAVGALAGGEVDVNEPYADQQKVAEAKTYDRWKELIKG